MQLTQTEITFLTIKVINMKLKNKYRHIIFDMDSTLFNFLKSEKISFQRVAEKYFGGYKDEYYSVYTRINAGYWLLYQKGKVTKDRLKIMRFVDTADEIFGKNQLNFDAFKMNEDYITSLAETPFLYDGAYELVKKLSEKYKLGIITNGIKRNQLSRLALTKMDGFFDYVIISEDIGKPKPDIAMFNACFEAADDFDKTHFLVIGDSFEADIKGGNNAGIDTLYIDMSKSEDAQKKALAESDIKPVYSAFSYSEIRLMLL